MLIVTQEALRVCRGAVCFVAAGKTKGRNYWPAVEGLIWECWRRGIHQYRPCYWHRNGIPGSGGDQWFRADIEYVTCFKREGKLLWSDNTAMGHAPKYQLGGVCSNRTANGTRAHADDPWNKKGRGNGIGGWKGAERQVGTLKKLQTRRKKNGDRVRDGLYAKPAIANPGVLVMTGAAGGGNIGDKLAHENEAPFPEKLAEHFIRSLCPPGGIVCDPFSGSGTVAKVATVLGRKFAAFDLRPSQVELTKRRVALVQPELIA